MANYKLISESLDRLKAETSKIDAKINFRDYVGTHFSNMAQNLDRKLQEANIKKISLADIYESISNDIIEDDQRLRTEIVQLSDEEVAKIITDTAALIKQLKEEGDYLISMLSNPDDQRLLRGKGGSGFLVKYLP